MDEEEELENTLIGQQEEVPVLGTEDALMGVAPQNTITFRDYDVPETSRANQLSVFGTSGNVKPNMSAITTAPQNPLPAPNEVNSALNQQVSVGGGQTQTSKFFEPGGFGYEYLGPRLGANIGQLAAEQLYGTGTTAEGQPTGFPIDRPTLAGDIATLPGNVLRGLDFFAGPVVDLAADKAPVIADYVTGDTGVQAQQEKAAGDIPIANAPTADGTMGIAEVAPTLPPEVQSFFGEAPASSAEEAVQRLIDTGNNIVESIPSLPEGVQERSPQANFLNRMRSGEALTQEEINAANALAKSIGTTFDPQTGYNRDPFLSSQASRTSTPLPGQTLTQFLRNEDAPEQRTEQFVDPQGRLRRRFTPEASALQGFAPGVQPLAPEYAGFQQASDDLDQRLRDRAKREGESQTERDTRIAQSRTTGGQTGGMSFDDARRRAEGQLAARGVRNPSSSQVNALARSIQAAEPERLEELETKRAINEARLKTAQATLDRPEFEGKVYTVNGVTFAQTSRGGAQVIDTGTKTPEQSTAQMQNFEFTLDQIDKARKAYLAGDVARANDILTAAEIKKNGIDVKANEYFSDFTPQVIPSDPASQVTASGLTQQQIEAGIQRVMADNKITREEAIKALEKERPEVFKLK